MASVVGITSGPCSLSAFAPHVVAGMPRSLIPVIPDPVARLFHKWLTTVLSLQTKLSTFSMRSDTFQKTKDMPDLCQHERHVVELHIRRGIAPLELHTTESIPLSEVCGSMNFRLKPCVLHAFRACFGGDLILNSSVNMAIQILSDQAQ